MPWLTLLIVLPLLGAVIAWFAGERLARMVGLVTALMTLAVSLVMALSYSTSSTAFLQFSERHSWIPAFGVSYSVGVDGIALVLIVMSTMLVPVTLLAGWHEMENSSGSIRGYVTLTLILESMIDRKSTRLNSSH